MGTDISMYVEKSDLGGTWQLLKEPTNNKVNPHKLGWYFGSDKLRSLLKKIGISNRSIKIGVSQNLQLIPNDMTQANEPNDSQREINRRFRDLSWRIERLETSQMPARSLNESFDRVSDEIDALEDRMNARFDRLEVEVRDMRAEMNGKFDTIMRHLTGLGDR